jgi:hypothetical protein
MFLSVYTVLPSPRTSLIFPCCHPLTAPIRPPMQDRAIHPPSGCSCTSSLTLTIVLLRAQTVPRHARERARWHRLIETTDATKGCLRCCKIHGSPRYYCSSPQSKSRLIFIAVVKVLLIHHHRRHQSTPAASPSPSNLSSPATFTNTNTPPPSFYCTPALHAFSIACALSDHSPLFLLPPSPFSLHSLIQRHQSNHSHNRNDG